MRSVRVLSVMAAAGLISASLTTAAQAKTTVHVSVLLGGLNSPKHLTIDPAGHLLIVESGVGDPTKKNCVSTIGDTGAPTSTCVAKTGDILRVTGHTAKRVLSGLPSAVDTSSGEVAGPASAVWLHNHFVVAMQDSDILPDGSTGLPGADSFGKLVTAGAYSHRSTWNLGPDLAAFALEHPQSNVGLGESPTDSDPYDIIPYKGGLAIADAAANDVLWLSPKGKLSILGRLPSRTESVPAGVLGPNPVTLQAQFVPTSLAVGKDGALYVGGLRGVPSLPGTASVYRIRPGHAPKLYASGFSAITDIAFDNQGRLMVLEFSTGGLLAPPTVPGALIRINYNHSRTTVLGHGLFQPTGLVVAKDGSIYIANHGVSTGGGEIVKIAFS
jgi:hypothetical protein